MMGFRGGKIGLNIVAAVALVVLTFGAAGTSAASVRDKVRVGTLKSQGAVPVFAAIEKGYFAEEGIDVELVWFAAAAPITVAAASGSIDVGGTGITASWYNMVAGGSQVCMVADRGMEKPGFGGNSFIVNKQLYDKGIVRSLKDLKGKKIGITTLGSTFHYQLGKLFEQEGMSLDDVELVPLKQVNIMMDAVREGTIAAAIITPPWGDATVENGWGHRLFWTGDRLTYQICGMFYSNEFRQKRDLAVRFMKAFVKGMRYYYDACFAKPPSGNKEEVLRIISKYTGQEPSVIEKSLTYMDRDARPVVDDLRIQQEWYLKTGMIQQIVPVEKLVDLSFLEEALRQLDRK